MTGDEVVPLRIDIPAADLRDLRERLERTRWPEPEPVADWSHGVPLDYLRELCRYWATGYDWRATEARLNEFPQFRTRLDGLADHGGRAEPTDPDGLAIHFVHVRSPHPNALPLVLTHGWPGSIVEFTKVIGPLVNPPDPADAFHVVCPSLPGYGWSDKPGRPGWTIHRIATAWTALMARLGYSRYGAQGGDWGSSITTSMAVQDPEHVAGIHLAGPLAPPDPSTMGDLTPAERAALDALKNAQQWESGYSAQMSTRPQTIGYSLVDSPAGLCAWIVEKFRAWTDCDGHPENALTRDEMLDNIMLYWLPATGASAARLYRESYRHIVEIYTSATTDTIDIPTGCTIFPKEMLRPSRRWAAKRFTNILHWNELERGGHFGAFEQPAAFVDEVRAFFRLVR